jgi:hypothetical protein
LNAGEGFRENLRRELQYTYSSKYIQVWLKSVLSNNKHFHKCWQDIREGWKSGLQTFGEALQSSIFIQIKK